MNIRLVNQSGVSLLEVLITTLILGVGLLGVAALQVSSISSNQEGFFTSQATSIAAEYSARIRSAKLASVIPSVIDPATKEYVPKNTLAQVIAAYSAVGAFTCTDDPSVMCRNDGTAEPLSCNISQLAEFDRWEMCNAAKDTLAEGRIGVTSSGNRMTLFVEWASASERKDMGTKKNINVNCEATTGSATKNCVILELLP